MAGEISGNSGYLALKVEDTPGVPVTPDTFVPLYSETISTDHQFDTNSTIVGSRAARLLVTPGVRAHTGDIEVLAEPNTTALLFDMLLIRDSVTGSNPYTWKFTHAFGATKTYTFDISTGNQVARFMGFQAGEISPVWNKNEMHWKVTGSALKSFLGAEVASIASDTITLATPINYPAPTQGLTTGDLVAIVKADGTTRQNFTIASLTDTTVTLSGTPTGVSAGDSLILRPATPTIATDLQPFLWSRTEFRFGATAATALNAAHTPLENGSTFAVQAPFDNNKGDGMSGSFDPAALPRSKTVDLTFSAKKYFYGPDEVRNYTGVKKVACVIRAFASGGQEFRLTMNDLRITKGGDKPLIKADESEFYELEYTPVVSETDGQMFDVQVINATAGA